MHAQKLPQKCIAQQQEEHLAGLLHYRKTIAFAGDPFLSVFHGVISP